MSAAAKSAKQAAKPGKSSNRTPSTRQEYLATVIDAHPDLPNLTLAKKVYRDHPEWFPNLDAARSAVRHLRGNLGKQNRQTASSKDLFRPNGRAGEPLPMPPSRAEPWTPYILPPKIKKPLILSDIHYPYHSELALSTAINYGIDCGCDSLILNGDIGDFFSISRYDKDPRQRDLPGELETIKDGLRQLRQRFHGKPIIFKEGNHEERWDKFLWTKAPELLDLPQLRLDAILELDKLKITHVADQRPIQFGSLSIFHGHELGGGSGINPARAAFMRTMTTMICGHWHRTNQDAQDDVYHGNQMGAWSTGCLSELHPRFLRVNKWNWGFAVLSKAAGGGFVVENRRISLEGQVW